MTDLISRGRFVAAGSAALASIAVIKAPARAAEWTYKYANNVSVDHPLNVRTKMCWNDVNRETKGRLDVQIFPNNQLGGDTQMLAQLRSGALQVMTLDGGILESVVPVAAIQSVGFAFNDSAQAFRAFDGKLGAYVRGEIATKGLHAFDKIWENGMREITTSTKPVHNAGDIAGMKIRTPNSRMALDLFKSLGAAPTPLNFSELYTALQTKVVDGQENPLANIEFARFYEVQKNLSLSSHMWGGYWLLAESDWFNKLPSDVQGIVTRNASRITDRQRADVMKLNDSLIGKLKSQGMTVNDLSAADRATMRAKLGDYYKHWKAEFGNAAWDLLESYSGKLA